MARALGQRFVDEDAQHAVLDQVRALLQDRHPREHHQVGGRHAQRHGYLRPAGPHPDPLRNDGRPHQEHAEQKENGGVQQAVLAQRLGHRPSQAKRGVNRRHDRQRP